MSELMTQEDEGLDEFSVGPAENPKRPDISHLPDAVTYDDCNAARFMADVGDTIVADISTVIGGNTYWLITRTGTVKRVDHQTGTFDCWDTERGQHFGGNYKTVGRSHTIYKLVPRGQKVQKRRRRRKNLVPMTEAPKNTPVATAGEPAKKRGRGRPPGSKNRPKDVIAAEKKARSAAKAGKKVVRRGKKR